MALLALKPHFSRFLNAKPGRLHFAAHSHHPWPDVSFEAHQRAWLQAAELIDLKWDTIFGDVIPEAQRHIARLLALPDPASIAFAPNTHEFVMRLLSCVRRRKVRVLTTDSEFHSFGRQMARLEIAGQAEVTRVEVEPVADFPQRLREAIAQTEYDLLYFSHVFFNNGYAIEDLPSLVQACPHDQALIAIDGYHAFMAMPVDVSAIASRAFYLAGGYKYAMAGEGVCFMHCPPEIALRPIDTGWYAEFGALGAERKSKVAYGADGSRFLGATFDPSGLYRFNAVQRWLQTERVGPAEVRSHVSELQHYFLRELDAIEHPHLNRNTLRPVDGPRGNFLCFRTPLAESLTRAWTNDNIVTDCRADRLRVGFGVYQGVSDLEAFLRRISRQH
jgi:selenocysteine lyase/cysteine desulfurase